MSFTAKVKSEICEYKNIDTENITELSAIIHNAGKISKKEIVLTLENIDVAKRINNLLLNTYGINPVITARKGYNFNKNYIYIISIKNNINKIVKDLSLENNIPEDYIYADSDLLRAYIRGLFLASGSVNDPMKSRYHLEFLVENRKYAKFISSILNSFYLNSKIIERDNKYMIYIKEAEKIGDFLRIIKANNAVMYFEDIRIYRDHVNMTNRLNNCEQANVDKQVLAATEEVENINLLKEKGLFDFLDEKLKEVAIYRLKYPDTALNELSTIITIETGNKLTKSGLYHRLRKINEMANKLKNKTN